MSILTVHVAAALVAIVTGIAAMLTHKGPGRHPRVGRWYLGALLVVFATACVLAGFRWPTDLPLVLVGGIGVAAALYGFVFRQLHRPGDVPHIVAMGVSYIAMLTAFYVDNGPHLPVWQLLPAWTFWVLPSVVGVPLVIRAALRRKRSTTAPV
ncbi:MAG: DUF2306 domain-containing protein [Microbacteriaceae bacterium]|nr:MAG: DUF2306 domain-containing protein [Microbacteriaceae bacterium]